jgi:hypothetical protein
VAIESLSAETIDAVIASCVAASAPNSVSVCANSEGRPPPMAADWKVNMSEVICASPQSAQANLSARRSPAADATPTTNRSGDEFPVREGKMSCSDADNFELE